MEKRFVEEDTIAAVSTAYGIGAVGIIRISGSKSFDIAARLFKGKKGFEQIKTHSISHGFIVDPNNGECIDEVLITKMEGPSTYTREDIVEINCHAGLETLTRVLELAIEGGARPAEPGEFTKRAFLNDRIDLAQAEAVMDIIGSTGRFGAQAAMSQLEGSLSRWLSAARGELLDIVASFDAVLDFPEHDLEEVTAEEARQKLERVKEQLNALESSFERGRIVRDGISCVIVGKPNVGKSSLLNLLSGKDRAIVTDMPGTTRDLVRENISIGGFSINVADSAGIRKTGDKVEKIGVDIAKGAAEKADLVIVVLDSACQPDEDDHQVISLAKGKPRIYMVNKTDIADRGGIEQAKAFISAVEGAEHGHQRRHGSGHESGRGRCESAVPQENGNGRGRSPAPLDNGRGRCESAVPQENGNERSGISAPFVIESSFVTGKGIAELEEKITEMFSVGLIHGNGEAVLTNKRHYAQVVKGITAIDEALGAIDMGLPVDMALIGMKGAASALGEITGEDCISEVVDKIFESFCVGK